MTIITEFAPAKINLYLHVTGRRADGYHNLDSLVTFVDVGDVVEVRPAPHFSFDLCGPYARILKDSDAADNLVVRAAHALAEWSGRPCDVAITLTKNLPVASGIGGGSSDAAAVLRALCTLWTIDVHTPDLLRIAARYGQDVPACLTLANTYLTAEGVIPAPDLPPVPVLLVNPNRALPTPDVYQTFRMGHYGFSSPALFTEIIKNPRELVDTLKKRTNDLTPAAQWLIPEIGEILEHINAIRGCQLARMSGSGATCFALFNTAESAAEAAQTLRHERPDWWIAHGTTFSR